jgi:hypothetical protein
MKGGLFTALALVFSGASFSFAAAYETTPLDDYVWAPDEHYGWVDSGLTIHGRNADGSVTYTGYLLNMTSQQWLTPADSSRSVWWHQLVVLVPSNLNPAYSRNATLWITGGGNENPNSWPVPTDEDIAVSAALAMGTGTITAALFQIPNEHIVFASDPLQKARTEDAIIAFTWDHFIKDPSDPTWLVRFPMVKASLRAMDAVAEFVQTLPDTAAYTAEFFTVAIFFKRPLQLPTSTFVFSILCHIFFCRWSVTASLCMLFLLFFPPSPPFNLGSISSSSSSGVRRVEAGLDDVARRRGGLFTRAGHRAHRPRRAQLHQLRAPPVQVLQRLVLRAERLLRNEHHQPVRRPQHAPPVAVRRPVLLPRAADDAHDGR